MSKHTTDDAMLEFCINELLKDFIIRRKWSPGMYEMSKAEREYLVAHLSGLVSDARKAEHEEWGGVSTTVYVDQGESS